MQHERLKYLQHRFTGPVYFGLLLLNIIGGMFHFTWLQVATKPLLMPVLMLCTWLLVPKNRKRNLLLFALFFSFAGDCLLLFEYQWPFLFIPGILCFLITHILYIFYFLSTRIKDVPVLKSLPFLIVLCILYGVIFLMVLYPSLGFLKFPVTAYALIIFGMLLSVFYTYTSLPPVAGRYFAMGALLFVLSDSLLAFDKFLVSLDPFAFTIMATYGFAQWFIVRGFIRMQG